MGCNGTDGSRRIPILTCILPFAPYQFNHQLALHDHGKWDYRVCIVDERLDKAGGKLLGSEGVAEMKQRLARSGGASDGGSDQPLPANQTKWIHCSGNCSNEDREAYMKAGADMVW